MKKFSYFCLTLVLMLSYACVKEEAVTTTQQPEYIVNNDGVELAESSLTVEQALKNMDFVQRNIEDSYRRKREIKNIDLLSTSDVRGNTVTRSSGDATAEQPLAYVVNFEDNGGYAILAADTQLPPVIMIGDEGNFSTEKYLEFLQQNTTRSGAEITDVEDMQYTMITNSIVFPPVMPQAPKNPRDTAVMVRCLPLVPTKWGQGSPYNYYAPLIDGERALAGCVPVACAQTLASLSYHHNFTPSVEISPEYPVNWSMINAAISNKTFKYNSNDTSNSALNVASLIRAIGARFNATYGVSETSSYTSLFEDELIRLGCSQADYLPTNSVSTNDLFDMIVDKNYPVTSRANDVNGGGGHSFILDGWLRLEYTGDVINGLNINNQRFQFDLVHVNFGWSGKSDGYYIPTSFNITEDEYRKYIENTDISVYYNYDFSSNINYIIYEL